MTSECWVRFAIHRMTPILHARPKGRRPHLPETIEALKHDRKKHSTPLKTMPRPHPEAVAGVWRLP